MTSEDRIRELCARAVDATDDEVLHTILPQLKDALREHLKNLRLMVAEYRFHNTSDLVGSRDGESSADKPRGSK